ncbi:Hypothetical predicted protein [Prunus dulcis]|uniref:Uncharacterized protein n=1 Tax=Prunus dulcis TaxID=3755 RepID=A0A5E4FNW1_PRUDU|nr:Hypothetical predicted protein [Prunus dulcis]
MVSSSTSSFVFHPDQACLAVVLVRFDELGMTTKVPRCLESTGCGFDSLSLSVGQGFRRLKFLGIILLPISTYLFDYHVMGIAESGGVKVGAAMVDLFGANGRHVVVGIRQWSSTVVGLLFLVAFEAVYGEYHICLYALGQLGDAWVVG